MFYRSTTKSENWSLDEATLVHHFNKLGGTGAGARKGKIMRTDLKVIEQVLSAAKDTALNSACHGCGEDLDDTEYNQAECAVCKHRWHSSCARDAPPPASSARRWVCPDCR